MDASDLPEPIGTLPVEALPPVAPLSAITLADYERAAVVNALRQCRGNRKEAARLLEISEATIYRTLMKSYGMK